MEPIRYASDFSGIEAPLIALHNLHVPTVHVWSCEKDGYAKQSLLANHTPILFFDDVCQERELPDIDVYVAGFPCQSFSHIGNRTGESLLYLESLKVISQKKPKWFILENVPAFKKSNQFKNLISKLHSLSYTVDIDVLNSKDYGVPQNRPRLFMMGTRKDVPHTYRTPPPLPMIPLDSFLTPNLPSQSIFPSCQKLLDGKRIGKKDMAPIKREENWVVACAGFGNTMKDMCPTLTRNTRYYLTKHGRYLTSREKLRLMGFPDDWKQVVSDSQVHFQAGNSMVVNVLMVIFSTLVS